MPVELQLLIVAHLDVLEKQMLRMTNRHFYDLIPPNIYYYDHYYYEISTPSYAPTGPEALLRRAATELNTTLTPRAELTYCHSCQRLCLPSKLDSKMHLRPPEKQFCVMCGSEWFVPLHQFATEEEMREYQMQRTFRYQDDETWEHRGVAYQKDLCYVCGMTAAMPVEIDPGEDYDDYGERVCSWCLPDWVQDKESRDYP